MDLENAHQISIVLHLYQYDESFLWSTLSACRDLPSLSLTNLTDFVLNVVWQIYHPFLRKHPTLVLKVTLLNLCEILQITTCLSLGLYSSKFFKWDKKYKLMLDSILRPSYWYHMKLRCDFSELLRWFCVNQHLKLYKTNLWPRLRQNLNFTFKA